MNNEILTELRDEIADVMGNARKCEGAYKGFRAFKANPQGVAFCAEQLHTAAIALREHVEHLMTIAAELLDRLDTKDYLELRDLDIDGRA